MEQQVEKYTHVKNTGGTATIGWWYGAYAQPQSLYLTTEVSMAVFA
jgi:hypothetical protein